MAEAINWLVSPPKGMKLLLYSEADSCNTVELNLLYSRSAVSQKHSAGFFSLSVRSGRNIRNSCTLSCSSPLFLVLNPGSQSKGRNILCILWWTGATVNNTPLAHRVMMSIDFMGFCEHHPPTLLPQFRFGEWISLPFLGASQISVTPSRHARGKQTEWVKAS